MSQAIVASPYIVNAFIAGYISSAVSLEGWCVARSAPPSSTFADLLSLLPHWMRQAMGLRDVRHHPPSLHIAGLVHPVLGGHEGAKARREFEGKPQTRRLLKLFRGFGAPQGAISRCAGPILIIYILLQAVSIASPAYALNEAAKLQETKSWSARLLETLIIIDGKAFLLLWGLSTAWASTRPFHLRPSPPSRRRNASQSCSTL